MQHERKTTRLKDMIRRPEMAFIMEAHNGLSARVAEEAGFEGIWGSGLSISAALGVRDHNEASWTQVLEVVEFMADATSVPILLDGDTGYGDFNTMQRVIRKLEQRGVAGVCIEDKIFPKTNSFIRGAGQPLANIDEFAGKIKAGKDAQRDDDFVIVARVEAFIAGWGLEEALKRAEAYRVAGADAILMHSALRQPTEILAFLKEWGNRLPVVIVPTKYYQTPTEVFREAKVSLVIWANHLMRSALKVMQATARQIHGDQSLINVEEGVAPLAEVFRIQGEHTLEEAEKRYLPKAAKGARAIVLAASQGDLGDLTKDKPKAMVDIAGKPLLEHIAETYRSLGLKEIAAVRGYRKDAVTLPNLKYFDNDQYASTQEVSSLAAAADFIEGDLLVSYGDVLFKKYIAMELLERDDDIAIVVDANHADSRNKGRVADLVSCSQPYSRRAFLDKVTLRQFRPESAGEAHGEWTGVVRFSPRGAAALKAKLAALAAEPDKLRVMKMPDLLQAMMRDGHEVRVIYTTGHWLDVDTVDDVIVGARF